MNIRDIGMNKYDGSALTGLKHIEQSIAEILTTPLGSRYYRPDFGCSLSDYVDGVGNDETLSRIKIEIARALTEWEPRITIRSVNADFNTQGRFTLALGYIINQNNSSQSLKLTIGRVS